MELFILSLLIGSNSRNKTKRRISKIHYHIANTKKDLIHKTTSLLAKTKLAKQIVIDDLIESFIIKIEQQLIET